MKTNLAVTGGALALFAIGGTHWFLGAHTLELFSLFLALTACVYAGCALSPAGQRYGGVELGFAALIFACSVAGLLWSPAIIAAGYFAHAAWDWAHHAKIVKTPVVDWFPPTCAVFDVVVGAFVLWWWWSQRGA